jgi:hypothetical protein
VTAFATLWRSVFAQFFSEVRHPTISWFVSHSAVAIGLIAIFLRQHAEHYRVALSERQRVPQPQNTHNSQNFLCFCVFCLLGG